MKGTENHSDALFVSPSEKTNTQADHYIGRFAPSPTGPLHFGSLIAATASYLCARKKKGQWLLRIEDVDTQREQKGASQSIIQTLEGYGFEWDGEIRFQSQHSDDYDAALATLKATTFRCSCTRKTLQQATTSSTSKYGYIYPGFCRTKITHPENKHLAIRVRSDIKKCKQDILFNEACQPKPLEQDIEKEIGDFILKRSDGLFAYQLAVVVDDELQGVTNVVRGADLFDNTPRQIYLQCLLEYKHPRYLHFPVAVEASGKKLSKQNLSPEISTDKKRMTLVSALHFLGQNPPEPYKFSNIDDLWKWAVQNWDEEQIPKTLTQRVL